MKLRARVALRVGVGLFVAVILLGLLGWRSEWRDFEVRYAAVVEASMRSGALAACEAGPGTWRGDFGRGTEAWAYGPSFLAANPAAPPFEPELERRLRSGESHVARWLDRGGPHAGALAVRIRGDGPCSVVLVRWTSPPGLGRGRVLARALSRALLQALLAALLVLLAVAPVVRRLRRLAGEVRRGERGAREPAGREGSEARDEIDEVAAAYDEAISEARAARRQSESRRAALEEFVGSATHDLLTPLSILQGALDEIGRSPASAARGLASAREEIHVVESLVADLAMKANAETGARAEILVDLGSEATRVVERHEPLARERGIALDAAVPEEAVKALLDPLGIRQALSNLVQNAIRHGREGGYAAVIVAAEAGRFRLEVRDDGGGDPASLAVHAGGAVGETAGRRHDRAGRGLGIVGRFAREGGLDLTFERSEDGGVVATLSGPLAPGNA